METVIELLGWSPLDGMDKDILSNTERCIIVFPHTSYFDIVVYAFYYLSWKTLRERCVIPVNPYHMERYGWICKHLGAITSTPRTEKGCGSTARFREALEKKGRFIFSISPKGTTSKAEWRSGYYYLAKELDCHIMPAGLDYDLHRFVFRRPFKVGEMSLEEVNARCKKEISNITPLNIENSEFPLDDSIREAKPCLIPALVPRCMMLMGLLLIVRDLLLIAGVW